MKVLLIPIPLIFRIMLPLPINRQRLTKSCFLKLPRPLQGEPWYKTGWSQMVEGTLALKLSASWGNIQAPKCPDFQVVATQHHVQLLHVWISSIRYSNQIYLIPQYDFKAKPSKGHTNVTCQSSSLESNVLEEKLHRKLVCGLSEG